MQDEPIEIQGVPDDAEPGPLVSSDDLRQNLSLILIAAGSVMLMVVILRMLRRSAAARAGTPRKPASASRAAAAPHSPARAGGDRLEQLMSDAEELTRRLAAHVDNKAARLEQLLADSDDRIRKLEELLEQNQTADRPGFEAGAPSVATPATDRNRAADPVHRKVYDLADRGMSPVDIARSIDRPTGQIELILALRRA